MSKYTYIKTTDDLRAKIQSLESTKDAQELQLKENFKELYHQYRPVQLIKNVIKQLGQDDETKDDIKGIGTNFGFQFLANQLFGRGTITGMFKATLAQRVMKMVYNQFSPQIDSAVANTGSMLSNLIGNLFSKKDDKKEADSGEKKSFFDFFKSKDKEEKKESRREERRNKTTSYPKFDSDEDEHLGI